MILNIIIWIIAIGAVIYFLVSLFLGVGSWYIVAMMIFCAAAGFGVGSFCEKEKQKKLKDK